MFTPTLLPDLALAAVRSFRERAYYSIITAKEYPPPYSNPTHKEKPEMRDWKEYLKAQEINVVPIGDVKPYPNNPRKNDRAVSAAAASIEPSIFEGESASQSC